jgi:hypothetical protein
MERFWNEDKKGKAELMKIWENVHHRWLGTRETRTFHAPGKSCFWHGFESWRSTDGEL